MSQQIFLSIVVPLLDEAENVPHLLESLRLHLDDLAEPYEIILVDDGSSDATWAEIQKACAASTQVRGLSLSRNFGHQHAILAGLHHCLGRVVVTMDGDLQHPPETIKEMLTAWRQGYKIVETKRHDAVQTGLFKRLSSRIFYRVFGLLSGIPVGAGTSDFRLLDRKVVEAIRDMRDVHLFLRGLTHWVGFPKTVIPYEANPRLSGRSKYSLIKMFRFSFSAVHSFSLIPLRIGIWIGLITAVLSFAELLYISIRYFQGVTVPGWASTLGVMSFMFGILFVLIGIIGTYIGGIYETVKNRPRFLINESVGFDADGRPESIDAAQSASQNDIQKSPRNG